MRAKPWVGVRLASFWLPAVTLTLPRFVKSTLENQVVFCFLRAVLRYYTVTIKVHFIIHNITLPNFFFCIIVKVAEDVSRLLICLHFAFESCSDLCYYGSVKLMEAELMGPLSCCRMLVWEYRLQSFSHQHLWHCDEWRLVALTDT